MLSQEEKRAFLELMCEEIIEAFKKDNEEPQSSTFFEAVENAIVTMGFSLHDNCESEGEEGFVAAFYDEKASYAIWEFDEDYTITEYQRYKIETTDYD